MSLTLPGICKEIMGSKALSHSLPHLKPTRASTPNARILQMRKLNLARLNLGCAPHQTANDGSSAWHVPEGSLFFQIHVFPLPSLHPYLPSEPTT